jgi:serine O-acetyltransferase
VDIAIVGWHDGLAGQIDSWYESSYDLNVKIFISPDDSPLQAVSITRANTKFSTPADGKFKGRQLILDPTWYLHFNELGVDAVVIAISDPVVRLAQIENAKKHKINLLNAIHPTSIIGGEATIGLGVILCAGVIVGYKCEISDGVIINTGAQIDHHNVIGKGVTIDPGCVFAGNVLIQEFSTIHTGVKIVNRINVGPHAEIGAGSLVLKDIEPYSVNFGSPSQFIRRKLE